jgi:hypothetical protein
MTRAVVDLTTVQGKTNRALLVYQRATENDLAQRPAFGRRISTPAWIVADASLLDCKVIVPKSPSVICHKIRGQSAQNIVQLAQMAY